MCIQQVPYTIKEMVSLSGSFIKRKSVLLSPTLGRSCPEQSSGPKAKG